MTLTAEDIMTSPVVTLSPDATLKDAHKITREKGIRHLPILTQAGKVSGIVTQKAMIARIFTLLRLYGEEDREFQEGLICVMEVAEKDFELAALTTPLLDIAPFFLENKHGCLPVVDAEHRLVGVITSSDFVKLSITLLKQQDV